MPIDVPAAIADGQLNGLDFVGVLRDCLSCAVITFDDQRKITALNPRAEQLTGLKVGRAIGHGAELLPQRLQQIIAETFSSGQSLPDHRLALADPRRGNLAIQATSIPIHGEGEKVTGVVVVLNDVSSVKKWEFNLRRLDRLHSVGTLSASMAHEVKNAFVAVRTFVDLLLEKNQEADLAEIVRQEMNRIDSIVGQMLKFSGPAKPALASLHLDFVLNKSLLLIQHLLEDKRIKLTRNFTASPDLMAGDHDQLEQAFLNLFFNALDALPENGRLDVSTDWFTPDTKIEGLAAAPGERVLRVIIRDSGSGISTENMERLFEPFFTTKPEGTGLGLAITRRIIQEHHGAISVESDPKKGTTFTLLLPAAGGA